MKIKRDQALMALENGKYADAIPLFLELIEDDKNDSSLYYMIGQCYRFLNDMNNAIIYLEKAKDLESKDVNIYLALGIAYQLIEEYKKAIRYFKMAIALDNDFLLAYNSMGLTYRKVGYLSTALKWYFAALERSIEFARKKAELEISSEEQEAYEEQYKNEIKHGIEFPLKGMKENLELNLDYAIISNNIGACYYDGEKYDEAFKWFINAIESTPKGYSYDTPHMYLQEMRGKKVL